VGVARTLVTSGLVWAAGSARAGAETAELAVRRMPALVGLGARATLGTEASAARANAAFRDELLMLFDDVSGVAWREARWARAELGARTSPRATDARAEATPARANGAARRRYRVKP
jgi:hypothetical protein